MPIVAQHDCPYCKKELIVETIASEAFPLGSVKLHKKKVYDARYTKKPSKV